MQSQKQLAMKLQSKSRVHTVSLCACKQSVHCKLRTPQLAVCTETLASTLEPSSWMSASCHGRNVAPCWHNAHIKLEKAWDTHALLWLLKSSIFDMWPHFYIIARLTWPMLSSSSASLGNAGMRDCIWRGIRLDQGEQMSWIFLGRAIKGKDAWSALSPQTWNFLSEPAWRQKRLWHETWELIADKPTKLEMKAHLALPWKDVFMQIRSLIFDHICLQRCEHSCKTLNSQSPTPQQVMTVRVLCNGWPKTGALFYLFSELWLSRLETKNHQHLE